MSNCTVDPRCSLEESYASREKVSRTCRGLKAEQSREDALVETGYCHVSWHGTGNEGQNRRHQMPAGAGRTEWLGTQ